MYRVVSVLGLLVMIGIAYALSSNRKAIKIKTVAWGIGLQFVFALLILKTSVGQRVFQSMGLAVNRLLDFTNAGVGFVFGSLADVGNHGVVIAIHVLPIIIFMSALSAILYYFGILQFVVKIMARVMTKLMGTSGAESLSAAANVFVGMTEAPLLIRPYVDDLTESELFCVMNAGMATIAGSVLAAYVMILQGQFPGIAGHLLSASIMSAPAALAIAKIMVPETAVSHTAGRVDISTPKLDVNVIDAAARGTTEGLKLALNVGAMLIAFYALIALVNYFFGLAGTSMQEILGWVLSPLAWVMGVPWSDAPTIGSLLGEKVIINEWIAYQDLAGYLERGEIINERSKIIAAYALCGFANFGSLGIMIGGIGGMAPKRKGDIARLGIKSIIGGSLAAFMTATIAGILL